MKLNRNFLNRLFTGGCFRLNVVFMLRFQTNQTIFITSNFLNKHLCSFFYLHLKKAVVLLVSISIFNSNH